MDERVIFVIREYIYTLFEPSRNWPEYEFRKRSYERWAASEILKRIQQNRDISPVKVIEKFARETDEYSGVDHDDRNDSFIFYVSHDVAVDILDVLRAMN